MEKIICMRKLSVIFAILALIPFAGKAQNSLNSRPDSVIGVFLVPEKGNDSKVEFTKNADGTYDCAIVWMESPIDPSTGKTWCDVKNPDKSLRGPLLYRAEDNKGPEVRFREEVLGRNENL